MKINSVLALLAVVFMCGNVSANEVNHLQPKGDRTFDIGSYSAVQEGSVSYAQASRQTAIPYPSDQRYWVVFREGWRNNRIELSTIDSNFAPDKLFIVWNKGLTLNINPNKATCHQYFLENGRRWVYMWDWGQLTSWASQVIASNLDIYDTNGNLILRRCNYSDVNWNSIL